MIAVNRCQLCTPNQGSATAGFGVMNMQIVGRFVGKQALNQRFKLPPIYDISLKHHLETIKSSN